MPRRFALASVLVLIGFPTWAQSSIGMCDIDMIGMIGSLEWTLDPDGGENVATLEKNGRTHTGRVIAVRPHMDGVKVNIRFDDMPLFETIEVVVMKTSDLSRVGFVELVREGDEQVVSVIMPFEDATCLARTR